jgi:hypothetical protein
MENLPLCDDSISFVQTQTRTGGTKCQSEFSQESKEEFCGRESEYVWVGTSDADPDPYVFGPPGSRSGSFYHQAKIVRKTLIPMSCDFFMMTFLSLKNEKKNFVRNLKVNDKNSRIRIH